MRRYACDRCGRKQPIERLIRSRFTRARYCAYDIDKCAKRAKRKAA